MGGAHLCTSPGCGLCTPARLKERLTRGERARRKLAGLIESLEADEDSEASLLLDLHAILSTLSGIPRFNSDDPCPDCHGLGLQYFKDVVPGTTREHLVHRPCPSCAGTGVQVDLPRGGCET